MKRTVFIVWVALFSLAGVAEFRIENVRAEPVLPWGKVAVSYDVTGTLPEDADTYAAWISVSNRTAGSVQTVESLSGDTVLRLGHHWIVGDCEADGVVLAPGVFSFGVGYGSSSETTTGWSSAVEVATPPQAEGAQVVAGVPFSYSSFGTGTVKVSVDGTEILSRTAAGTGVWQPTATGRHVLAHTAGTNTWSRTVDVFSNLRVVNVRATPVAPWGRIVVDYAVAGLLPTNAADYVAVVTASNRATGVVYVDGTAEGETALTLGNHRVWWDTRTAGLWEAAESVDVWITYEKREWLKWPLYCVVDLSGGSTATIYPVSYLSNISLRADAYSTTKLVLRRIEPGSFIMGDNQIESHRVTLTKPFYMGIFEVTQKQWELVMGSSCYSSSSYGRGDAYPAYYVSYDDIRGSSSGAQWPASAAVDASSFLGRLRAKTGLEFDLPTEAQWEYACRAGTTTTYYWGDSTDRTYAWFYYYGPGSTGSTKQTHSVGTRTPNAWGLYDMSGNVWEWCRDWYGTLAYGADPVGSASGSGRVLRGGSWYNNANYCTSSYRGDANPLFGSGNYGYGNYGFRLVRVLSY